MLCCARASSIMWFSLGIASWCRLLRKTTHQSNDVSFVAEITNVILINDCEDGLNSTSNVFSSLLLGWTILQVSAADTGAPPHRRNTSKKKEWRIWSCASSSIDVVWEWIWCGGACHCIFAWEWFEYIMDCWQFQESSAEFMSLERDVFCCVLLLSTVQQRRTFPL